MQLCPSLLSLSIRKRPRKRRVRGEMVRDGWTQEQLQAGPAEWKDPLRAPAVTWRPPPSDQDRREGPLSGLFSKLAWPQPWTGWGLQFPTSTESISASPKS